MGGVAFLVIAVLGLGLAQPAGADDALGSTALPAPYWAKTIEVVDDGAPLMIEHDPSSRL